MGNNFSSSGGHSAGRDINNLNLHLGERKPESQLQSEFAQRTGIWCPKPAREWLEFLMEEQRFTAKELRTAWKAGSIGWNADKDSERVVTIWLEAFFAYGLIAMMTVYCLAIALPFADAKQHDVKAMAFFIGLMLSYLGVCWMAARFMLNPRRVALRIKRLGAEGTR